MSNAFIILLSKAWLPAVPDALHSARETSVIPSSLLKNCLLGCVQRCSSCLHSLGSQPS